MEGTIPGSKPLKPTWDVQDLPSPLACTFTQIHIRNSQLKSVRPFAHPLNRRPSFSSSQSSSSVLAKLGTPRIQLGVSVEAQSVGCLAVRRTGVGKTFWLSPLQHPAPQRVMAMDWARNTANPTQRWHLGGPAVPDAGASVPMERMVFPSTVGEWARARFLTSSTLSARLCPCAGP
jgi:hypothetical protein